MNEHKPPNDESLATLEETEDCAGEFQFPTVLMMQWLCVCMTPSIKATVNQLAVVHIVLCLCGVVVLLLSLVVSSTMITKSSTAVLVSILLLYNLLRLTAHGVLSSFTVVDNRVLVQKICNAAWLLGTWGVHYTLLGLALEQVLAAFRPKLAQTFFTPIKAIRRSSLVMLLGMLASGNALVQAARETELPDGDLIIPSCDDSRYYFAYWEWYQTLLVATFWVVPQSLINVCFLLLLGHVFRRQVLQKNLESRMRYRQYSNARDILEEQKCILCLLGWNMGLNLPLAHQLLLMVIWKVHIPSAHITELCVVLAMVGMPFSLLLWRQFRQEGVKAFPCCLQQGPIKASRSVTRSFSVATWG